MPPLDLEKAKNCTVCVNGLHTPAVSGMPRPCPYCQRQCYAPKPAAYVEPFASDPPSTDPARDEANHRELCRQARTYEKEMG
jgi:hypothetical protein